MAVLPTRTKAGQHGLSGTKLDSATASDPVHEFISVTSGTAFFQAGKRLQFMPRTAKLKYQIVTSADVNFLPAACCMLISANAALETNTDVMLMLVAVDVSESEAEKTNTFLKAHGVAPCVRTVSSQEFVDPRLRVDRHVTKASYIRLVLDRIISRDVDRVLYLDADIRVLSSLAPLFETDMQGFPLAAVKDIPFYQHDRLKQKCSSLLMPENADYFNAGVLLFDWPETLRSGLLDKAMKFACTHQDLCVMHDQDALNSAAANNWKPLDPRWNLIHHYFSNGGKQSAWIKHFTGKKPWSRHRPKIWRQDAIWMKNLLADSPWPEYVERQSWIVQLGIMVKRHLVKFREHRRLIGYHLVPHVMSSAAKQRAQRHTKLHRHDVENLVSDMIRQARK